MRRTGQQSQSLFSWCMHSRYVLLLCENGVLHFIVGWLWKTMCIHGEPIKFIESTTVSIGYVIYTFIIHRTQF